MFQYIHIYVYSTNNAILYLYMLDHIWTRFVGIYVCMYVHTYICITLDFCRFYYVVSFTITKLLFDCLLLNPVVFDVWIFTTFVFFYKNTKMLLGSKI